MAAREGKLMSGMSDMTGILSLRVEKHSVFNLYIVKLTRHTQHTCHDFGEIAAHKPF